MAEILDFRELKQKHYLETYAGLENECSHWRFMVEDSIFYRGYAEQLGTCGLLLYDWAQNLKDDMAEIYDRVDNAVKYGPIEDDLLTESRQRRAACKKSLDELKAAINKRNKP